MKRLSDYQGEDAIELWADLLEPASEILADPVVKNISKSKKKPVAIAGMILKRHKEKVCEMLLRIDPEPLNGLTAFTRLVSLIAEMMENKDMQAFFASQGQMMAEESSGSVTESTEDAGN